MPVGLGWLVDRWCMVLALGLVDRKLSGGIMVFGVERRA